jgi:hypothetical protein
MLIYAGGPFAFLDCEIDAQTILSLNGAAARAAALWEALGKRPDLKEILT